MSVKRQMALSKPPRGPVSPIRRPTPPRPEKATPTTAVSTKAPVIMAPLPIREAPTKETRATTTLGPASVIKVGRFSQPVERPKPVIVVGFVATTLASRRLEQLICLVT